MTSVWVSPVFGNECLSQADFKDRSFDKGVDLFFCASSFVVCVSGSGVLDCAENRDHDNYHHNHLARHSPPSCAAVRFLEAEMAFWE